MLDKTRPFFTMMSKLKDIPREWLMDIEPKILRGTLLKECWIWQGALDKEGHPTLNTRDPVTDKIKTRRAARYVMQIFFPKLAEHHDVTHACGNYSCLNPHHLSVRIAHWSQESKGHRLFLTGEAGKVKPGVHTRGKPSKT